jgi:hypothetical protein
MTTRAVSGIELFDEFPNAIVVEAWSFEEFLRGSRTTGPTVRNWSAARWRPAVARVGCQLWEDIHGSRE